MNFKFSVREVKSFQKDLSEAVVTTLTSGEGQEFSILETGLSPSITLNRNPSLDNGGGTGYRRYSMAEFSNVPPWATPNPGIGAVRGEAAPPGTILEQSEPNPGRAPSFRERMMMRAATGSAAAHQVHGIDYASLVEEELLASSRLAESLGIPLEVYLASLDATVPHTRLGRAEVDFRVHQEARAQAARDDEFYLQSGMVRPPPPDQVLATQEETLQWRREQIAGRGVRISPPNQYCPPVAQIDLSPEQMEMIRNTLASGHNPFVPIVAASPGRVVASNLCPEVNTQPHLEVTPATQGRGWRVLDEAHLPHVQTGLSIHERAYQDLVERTISRAEWRPGYLAGPQTTGRNPLADAWDAASAEVRITVQLPVVAHHIDVPVNLSDILPAVTNNAVDAASYLVAEATNRPGLMRSVMEGRGLPPTRTISASVRVDPSDV